MSSKSDFVDHFYGKKVRILQPVAAEIIPLESGNPLSVFTEDDIRFLESASARTSMLNNRSVCASPGAQTAAKSIVKSISESIDQPSLLFDPVGCFTTERPTAGALSQLGKQLALNAEKRRKRTQAKPVARRRSNPDAAEESGAAAGSNASHSSSVAAAANPNAVVDRDPRLVEAYKHVGICEDLTKMTKHVRTELVAGTKWKGAITTVDSTSGRPVRKAENYTLEVVGFDGTDRVLCGKHVRKSKVELVGHVTIKVMKATGKSGVKLMVLVEDEATEFSCIGGMHADQPILKGIVVGPNISGEFSLERVE